MNHYLDRFLLAINEAETIFVNSLVQEVSRGKEIIEIVEEAFLPSVEHKHTPHSPFHTRLKAILNRSSIGGRRCKP